MMPPQELADRLLAGGRRDLSADRLRKFLRHVESRQHYDETLACLPDETRMLVDDQIQHMAETDPKVREKVAA